MEYYVFMVRLADKGDVFTVNTEWGQMVRNAKPANKVTADTAREALIRFAEREGKHSLYADYVVGSAATIEEAANIKVEYVPRAWVCCGIDMHG